MNRMNHAQIETKNSLTQSIRSQSVGLLNRNLALAIDLERQAKQAHWNVKGPNFIALHELFDKVAETAEEFTDLLAERATALGGTAEGRLHAVAERCYGAGGEEMAPSSLREPMECPDAPAKRPEQVPRRPGPR